VQRNANQRLVDVGDDVSEALLEDAVHLVFEVRLACPGLGRLGRQLALTVWDRGFLLAIVYNGRGLQLPG
jgi:hypothetical protein